MAKRRASSFQHRPPRTARTQQISLIQAVGSWGNMCWKLADLDSHDLSNSELFDSFEKIDMPMTDVAG